MNVITLRDYAKQNNISYEAVRKQVVRYQDELAGHLIRDGRQQFLDEEAVAFLDARRQKNPVAIIQIEKDEKIEQLEKENKQLLMALADVQNALLKEREQTGTLLAEKNAQVALLQADNEASKGEVAKARGEALEALQRALMAKEGEDAWKKYATELAAYEARPWWKRRKADRPVAPVLQED